MKDLDPPDCDNLNNYVSCHEGVVARLRLALCLALQGKHAKTH